MAQAKPRALFIGVDEVGNALKDMRKEWEFLPHVPDIQALWAGLTDQTISNDIQVILVMDHFFDPSGTDSSFEQLVAYMGPHCFLGVVNYHPNLREHMKERITSAAYSMGDTTNLNYYFIDTNNTNPSIDKALNEFIATSPSDEIVAILSGRVTSEERQTIMERRTQDTTSSSSAFFKDDEEEESPYLGKVVAVTSSKGGSGKSATAILLATYIAHASVNSVREGSEERPLKVIIVDLDVRDGQLGFVTGNNNPTVINLRLNGISRDTIEDTVIHDKALKVDLLLAPKRPRHVNDTPPEFYVDLLQNLRKMYDYVILDTSVNYLDSLLEKVAYPTADQIIFVTDIVVNSIFSMTRWIQEVTKPKDKGGMGINSGKIAIVINKFLADVAMPGDKIKRAAIGLKILAAIPSQPKVMAHAANIQSMNTVLRQPEIVKPIRRIARQVTGMDYQLSDSIKP